MENQTTLAVLRAQVQYPLPSDFFLSVMIKRGLDGDAVCTQEIMDSAEFIGAQADCIRQIILYPSSISEGGMSLSKADRNSLITMADKLYRSIGEETIGECPKITYY